MTAQDRKLSVTEENNTYKNPQRDIGRAISCEHKT